MKAKKGKKSFKQVVTLGVTGAILSSTLLAPASALAAPTTPSQPTTNLSNYTLANVQQTSPKADIALQLAAIRHMEQAGPSVAAKNFIPPTWIKKAIVNAIRYGGPYLTKIVGKVNKNAAKWLDGNLKAAANAIEAVEDWTQASIYWALVNIGCPPDYAAALSQAIMWLL
jgi:predicted component of type VI protein secretion system